VIPGPILVDGGGKGIDDAGTIVTEARAAVMFWNTVELTSSVRAPVANLAKPTAGGE
jgi:hypothetical protein